MEKAEWKRICNEWLESWEEDFKKTSLSEKEIFWYPIFVHIMSNETEKAQMVSVGCYDNNSKQEMSEGDYFSHPLNGKSFSVLMWIPKKVIAYEHKNAPYGIIKKNLLEKMAKED